MEIAQSRGHTDWNSTFTQCARTSLVHGEGYRQALTFSPVRGLLTDVSKLNVPSAAYEEKELRYQDGPITLADQLLSVLVVKTENPLHHN